MPSKRKQHSSVRIKWHPIRHVSKTRSQSRIPKQCHISVISSGEKRAMDVSSKTTVQELKQIIHEEMSLSPGTFTSLMLGPTLMHEGSQSLQSYGIKDGAEIYVYQKVLGEVVTASYDTTAKVWDSATGDCKLSLFGHSSAVCSVVFSPDSSCLATASQDLTAKVWDAKTGACRSTLCGHKDFLSSVAFSHDVSSVATASYDRTAKIWDAATGVCKLTLTGHTMAVTSAVFSPDGCSVLTASFDSTAKIWDARTGACKLTLAPHASDGSVQRGSAPVRTAAFSPDGKLVVTTTEDRAIRIWDALTGECKRLMNCNTAVVNSATFSLDMSLIITNSTDNRVRFWDWITGECKQELDCGDIANSAAFSIDSSSSVCASSATPKVHDASSGDCVLCFRGHGTGVLYATFHFMG